MALRTLATVCCVSEGIEYLNKINGIALIADILCDPGSSEEERREAAGVMAQLTSPWVDLTGTVDLEAMCTKKVVTSLTELCETGESQETYLLACAALANLTYAETQCADVMREISTPKRLISASSRHERNAVRKNIFACDQIATILANLAANPSWHKDLSAPEVVDVLSSFLFENVGENDSKHHRTKAERAALERVLQKTIVAISRISCEPHVAKSFISNKSLDRISQLCQDPEERMKSEAILVASMACIRKIAATLEDPSILSRLGPLISSKASPRSASAFLNNLKQPESYV
ncbi:unnamed protein product [Cyprideis torosa]|uniref:Protein inscuteable homologue C-terminal domain-containing protein n=1 Tax=Cyprideis torosa TaxID=163714 RepID=A0A7R8ZLY0_9CRUS|nr:unnamed protein product [Cyprideis torosa]CAG0887688.1 unnamed protein product [Cyprideis torosa]